MPFVVFVAYCNDDYDLCTFSRVYEENTGIVLEDVYREAHEMGADEKVSPEELEEWEGGMVQPLSFLVYRVPEGEVRKRVFKRTGEWEIVFPA